MKYIEYGKQNRDVIMMLHGGGLSWWNYRDEAELLCGDYHVILPVISGHADSGSTWDSIEAAAGELIDYIRRYCNGKIKALCGLSLGAQIAVEMLSRADSICEYAVIESVSLIPSEWTEKMIGPAFSMSYGLVKQPWFSRLQFRSLHIREALYEDYYRDTCLISKEDLIGFTRANTGYALPDSIRKTNAAVKVVVGSREYPNMRKSAVMLRDAVPQARLTVMEGLYHGEYSLNKPEEYVKDLLDFIQ